MLKKVASHNGMVCTRLGKARTKGGIVFKKFANSESHRTSPAGRERDLPHQKHQKHAWFTDGSAKYIGGTRCGEAVAYNPVKNISISDEGRDGSSQLAELVAIFPAIQKKARGI